MPTHLDASCKGLPNKEDKQGGPGPGYGSAQEPEVGIGSEKLHWEEEVIGPVIFGNNYDPLQEVIVTGKERGKDHLLVETVCAQR